MNRQLPNGTGEDSSISAQFLDILKSALSIRTRTIPQTHSYNSVREITPRVAILFSGGLDCSVLAFLIHTLLPPAEPIDLINVAFENPRTVAAQNTKPDDVYNVCPDRITGRAGWEELESLSQGTGRNWRFVEVCSSMRYSSMRSSKNRSISRTKKPCVSERRSQS
jgi:asparagine synthetase B (glutamine-hydrolysing)